jgi:hypothetical protein
MPEQVSGWGYNEQGKQPKILQKVVLPVRTYWDCYQTHKIFFSLNLKPGVSFCAGKNGSALSKTIHKIDCLYFFKARTLALATVVEVL